MLEDGTETLENSSKKAQVQEGICSRRTCALLPRISRVRPSPPAHPHIAQSIKIDHWKAIDMIINRLVPLIHTQKIYRCYRFQSILEAINDHIRKTLG